MAVSGLEMSHSIATYVISSKKKMMFLIQNVFKMSSGCSLTSFVIWCFYSSLKKLNRKANSNECSDNGKGVERLFLAPVPAF